MCKNKDYCNVKITEARNKVLKFNQDQKSMKIQFTIYTGIASWIEAKQSIWGNRVLSGGLAEVIHRHETELRAKAKNGFEKDFFKLMSDSVSGKTVENVENHKDFKLITTDSRISHLMFEQNYHTAKCFSQNLLALEMNKTKIKMDKPVYLGLLILDIREIAMYECWHDYAKPEYGDKSNLCYTDTDNFIVHVT